MNNNMLFTQSSLGFFLSNKNNIPKEKNDTNEEEPIIIQNFIPFDTIKNNIYYQQIKDIGLENFLNVYIVNKCGRNSFLLQYCDQNEKYKTDPKTSKILHGIRKWFPKLYFNELENNGMFISKENIDISKIKSSSTIGKALDYHGCDEFDFIDNTSNTYSYSIMAALTIDAIENFKCKSHIQLFAIKTQNDNYEKDMKNKALKFMKIIKEDKLLDNIVQNIYLHVEENFSCNYLIDKILSKELLDEYEKFEISNILYNCGFSPSLMEYEFLYDNPIHIGILITILTYALNNPLEPFYPLQHSGFQNEVNEITNKLENSLLNLLNKKIKNEV